MISYFPTSNGLKQLTKYGSTIYICSNGTNPSNAGSHANAIYLLENTQIGSSLASNISIKYIYAPECSTIHSGAFSGCTKLASISLPKCTTIPYGAFKQCYSLTSLNLPNCEVIYGSATQTWGAFNACTYLSVIYLPKLISFMYSYIFSGCTRLMSIYLTNSSVCYLHVSNIFNSTPITTAVNGTYGSIYVPSSLLSNYKAANNWSYFSNRFVGI